VGAAIAAGNQGEKGKSALLVIRVRHKIEIDKDDGRKVLKTLRSLDLLERRTIVTKKNPSPSRFISTVK